ncbi:MAG: MBL fold metallo-hydrolase [Fibrobacteres bacterium]|nr:MBL fold metallo-hydrolase [Fibrobacterota bacterium]
MSASAAIITKIASGIFAFIPGPPERLASNSTIIIGDKFGIIIDCQMTPERGVELWDAYKKLTTLPLKHVILTHWHGDHWIGHDKLPYESMLIHKSAFSQIVSEGEKWVAAFSEKFPPGTMDSVTIPKNVIQIDRDTTIDLGGLKINLIPAGPAHSAGDIIIKHAESSTVISGDLFFVGRPPYAGDPAKNKDRWQKWMQTISEIKNVAIVPGHGKPIDGNTAKKLIQVIN